MDGAALRVLVADDQDVVRESICDTLDAVGHQVCGAVASGEDAVEQAARLHPDVVLMDINMPGMGGIEAARLIRDLPEPVPVVFLTALSDREVASKAVDSGGFGYLVKPIHTQQIGPMLQTAVQRFRDSRSQMAPAPEAEARPALDQLISGIRTSSIESAAAGFVAAVAACCRARGAAIALLDPGRETPLVPARWGVVPPAASPLWPVGAMAAQPPGAAQQGTLYAPIRDAAGVPVGMLVLFGVAAGAASRRAVDLLKVYAPGLGEVLAATRAQQPIAWRRWIQAAPPL